MGKTVICVIERRNSVSTHEDVPQFKMTFLDILFLIYLELNLNTQIFWLHYQAFFLELHVHILNVSYNSTENAIEYFTYKNSY